MCQPPIPSCDIIEKLGGCLCVLHQFLAHAVKLTTPPDAGVIERRKDALTSCLHYNYSMEGACVNHWKKTPTAILKRRTVGGIWYPLYRYVTIITSHSVLSIIKASKEGLTDSVVMLQWERLIVRSYRGAPATDTQGNQGPHTSPL